jgi:hypothetical protein
MAVDIVPGAWLLVCGGLACEYAQPSGQWGTSIAMSFILGVAVPTLLDVTQVKRFVQSVRDRHESTFFLSNLRKTSNSCAIIYSSAAVAQLDRVLGYEPRGRGFNSCQPHQNAKPATKVAGFFVCASIL